MCPIAQSDGHDPPGLINELVPSVTAVIYEIFVGPEDAVRKPVVAHVLPDVFDWVELRRFRRHGDDGDIGWHDQTR